MKKTLLLSLLVFLYLAGSAQGDIKKVQAAVRHLDAAPDTIKHWTWTGVASLNVNQVYLVNWAAGGQSSIGLNTFASFQAGYRKGKHSWQNNLDMAYGFQYLAPGSSDNQYRKTDDRIELNSSYGYGISKTWDLSAILNFKTQFTDGYNYPNDSVIIAKFMSPGYLIAGLGFTWVPVKSFNLFMSPAAGRLIFVIDPALSDSGACGVDRGKKVKAEFGAYVRASLNQELGKSASISSTLDLFTNYFKNFGDINVNWNMLLTLKAGKWLATSVNLALIYDDQVMITDIHGKTGPRTQFRENIGVGISYRLH
ncbi:MAG: DUF3078 domain-containing protein [Bacteroidetes bacterium]|nr:DUF3078 domain-containing protein [Bacteroidota bacterium]